MNDRYKLNWRYHCFTCFLMLFIYPIIKVMVMIAGNKITGENGEPLSLIWRIVVGIIIFFFGSLYIYVALSMLWRTIKNRGAAFIISENGIESTFTFQIVLALILLGRIKCIPWCAIKSYQQEDGGYTLKLDTSKVQASRMAKVYLKLFGYRFCKGFTQPISQEDFSLYIQPHIDV